jgi:hypothetical protein
MTATDFLESDQGKVIARSKQFLAAAETLMRSSEYEDRPKLLLAPTLHLAAHGIELLLKFPHFRAGMSAGAVGSAYGHDLKKLWADERARTIRELAKDSAALAWEAARESARWDDDFRGSPEELVEEFLSRLAELHGKDTNFGLRYLLPAAATGPRPGLIVDTFLDVSDRVLKNPSLADPMREF